MRDLCLGVFHRLPSGGRNVIATLRGYYLRGWRYGNDTQRLVEEALEREAWSAKQWRDWQDKRLHQLLRGAATQVPFYREHGPRRTGPRDQGTKGPRDNRPESRGDWSRLENWPVLKKESVRTLPRDFLADDCDSRRMWCEHTSGSTGTPLTLWQSHETVRYWYALFEARWRRWYGLSRKDRWAIIGGQLVTPTNQTTPPYWVWNAGLSQLYLSAYHLAPGAARHYVRALEDYGVTYLWGYASALSTLARFALDQDLTIPCLKSVISNAEPLFAYQRQVIRQAFRCPVYNTYSMSEMVCAASECEHGTMHLWPESGIWEVLDDDSDGPVAPGETGRLVATGLVNPDIPLIRYEVGDRVAMAPAKTKCACGRTLPVLKSVEGRSDDMIIAPGGRRIGRLDPVFKSGLPIVEAQVVQDAPDHLLVRVVPADGFGPTTEEAILEALQETVGPMRATVERIRSIPRGANGKFKAVVSLLTPSEREGIAVEWGSAGRAADFVAPE
jgi:phenylacetate-CoA ligase